jgi:hypothetical protein
VGTAAVVELCGQRFKPRRTRYKTYEIKFLEGKKETEIKSHGRNKAMIFCEIVAKNKSA